MGFKQNMYARLFDTYSWLWPLSCLFSRFLLARR